MNKEEYRQYLSSNEWRGKRERVLRRDKNRCIKCHSVENLQIHHLTYERVGKEFLCDLITLCRKCHERVHEKELAAKKQLEKRINDRKNRPKYRCYQHFETLPRLDRITKRRGYIAITVCRVCQRQINLMRRKDLDLLQEQTEENRENQDRKLVDKLILEVESILEDIDRWGSKLD
jgi:hypothetical protein